MTKCRPRDLHINMFQRLCMEPVVIWSLLAQPLELFSKVVDDWIAIIWTASAPFDTRHCKFIDH